MKLGPRVQKCIFIRYSDELKGYVMLGEHLDGSVTEIESQDVDFLEGKFPRRGEVKRNLGFYEMNEPEESAQIPIEIESDSIPSGSVPLSESVPLDISSQDP